MNRNASRLLKLLTVGLVLLAAGCATPVRVERVDPASVHQELTGNVLTSGTPSGSTRIVLRRNDLTDRFEDEPDRALVELHAAAVADPDTTDRLFALAELSFLRALATGHQARYLAAAVYAYAFLFPEGAEQMPNPFDPRLRLAADLYNRGLTEGFATADGAEIALRAGRYRLPFGVLDVAFDPAQRDWAGRRLERFVPVAELAVEGLANRYRQAGLGAPLAASAMATDENDDNFVAPNAKVPVSALLRIDDARRQLARGRIRARLELHPFSEQAVVEIDGRQIPLELESTAALAYGLSTSQVWEWEYQGFLFGDLLSDRTTQLAALEPYQPGRIPVVFVHGTVSSPGRWADMVNDLQNDPRIRERFQFWFFFYDTGNPIAYSAMRLRESLQQNLARFDPEGRDPALRRMVVIGHSQGGLLAKMTAIDSGSALWNQFSDRPLDELDLEPGTRDLLRRALFIEPLPFVRRLVFISTPHRGSYVAGSWISQQVARLVRLPGRILNLTADALAQNPEAFPTFTGRIGSVYGMTPGSPFIRALAPLPIAPEVAVHSIIAVRGDGPPEQGNDGVVEYSSAHLDSADSELIVRSGHSAQSNPHTIEEVRRILLLTADE